MVTTTLPSKRSDEYRVRPALAPGVGLTGNRLSGTMVADAKNLSWVAEGVPVTAYDDDGTWDPYGKMTVTVKDSGGGALQTADVVTPVSGEMSCFKCHGTTNTFQNILAAHDKYNGTTLAADLTAGKHHRCSEGACHVWSCKYCHTNKTQGVMHK